MGPILTIDVMGAQRTASLDGLAPITASSAKTVRHRLNQSSKTGRSTGGAIRSSSRGSNPTLRPCAGYPTPAEGKTVREVMRWLKRFVAGQLVPAPGGLGQEPLNKYGKRSTRGHHLRWSFVGGRPQLKCVDHDI
jgi:hypothetical protein